MSRARMYEQERLLLHVQERLAEAIARSGRTRRSIARKLGRHPPSITRALSDGLSISMAADIAWATGYRLEVSIAKQGPRH